MYDVQDVAEYVITYSEVKDYGISNLKLQKILYLIQAYSLIHTKKPCFSEDIEAWDFWPVIPEGTENINSSAVLIFKSDSGGWKKYKKDLKEKTEKELKK